MSTRHRRRSRPPRRGRSLPTCPGRFTNALAVEARYGDVRGFHERGTVNVIVRLRVPELREPVSTFATYVPPSRRPSATVGIVMRIAPDAREVTKNAAAICRLVGRRSVTSSRPGAKRFAWRVRPEATSDSIWAVDGPSSTAANAGAAVFDCGTCHVSNASPASLSVGWCGPHANGPEGRGPADLQDPHVAGA